MKTFKLHLEDLLRLSVKTQFLIREVMDTCSDAEENANKVEQKLCLTLFCQTINLDTYSKLLFNHEISDAAVVIESDFVFHCFSVM